jgi:hypothetical protein
MDISTNSNLDSLTGTRQTRPPQAVARPPHALAQALIPVRSDVSRLARACAKALALYEDASVARPEAVERGQRALEPWRPLSEDQIDRIARDMIGC